MKTPKTFSAVR